jgi:nucleotide-binding universal stress UspA family protein
MPQLSWSASKWRLPYQAILAVADEISAPSHRLWQRGRSPLRTASLGSVSPTLAAHTRRPVLIAPEKVL